MKNGHIYFKYGSILVCVIILAWVLNDLNCGGSGGSRTKTDTVSITRDTIIYVHDTTISYVPKPYKVEKHIYEGSGIGESRTVDLPNDLNLMFDSLPPIVKNAYEDYYSKKYYDTTITQKSEYGSYFIVKVKDTLYKNAISGRSIGIYWESAAIHPTVTLREKPRTVVYGGLTVLGNRSTPLFATGAKLGFLAKNGRYYGGSYLLTKGGGSMYQVDVLLPIRLKNDKL